MKSSRYMALVIFLPDNMSWFDSYKESNHNIIHPVTRFIEIKDKTSRTLYRKKYSHLGIPGFE